MEPAWTIPKDVELGAVAACLGCCVFIRTLTTAMFSARTEKHLQIEGRGHLKLRIHLKGRSIGTLGEDSFKLSAGDIQVFDFSRPYRSVVTDADTLAVIIPHAEVGYDPARHPGQFTFTPESPRGRILEESTWALFNRLSDVRQSEAEQLAENYCALIRGIIHMEDSGDALLTGVRQRRGVIQRFIDRSLSNPRLKVSDICLAFNTSRASVYREFEEFGGFARYVTERRLEAALRGLANSGPSKGLIEQVAEGCGFQDPEDFHNQFRAEFGFSPGEFVSLCETGAAAPPGRENGSVPKGCDAPDISLWLKCDTGKCPAN